MIRGGWRRSHLIREAVRNLLTPRLLALVVLALVLGSAGPVFAMTQGSGLTADLSRLGKQGRNVVLIEGASRTTEARISRDACEALSSDAGVVRAGALVQSPAVSVVQLGMDIPAFSASSTLFPALRSADALVGSDLGRQLKPTVMSLLSGQMLKTMRANAQPEGIPTNRSLVFSLSPDVTTVPSCIIQLGQFESAQDRIPELLAQLRVTDSPLSGRAVLVQQFDLVEQYRASALQFVPLVLGLLGGVAAALVNASRSREFATYRLSGTSRTSLLVILVVEEIILGLTMTVGATVTTAVLWPRLLGPLECLSFALAAGGLWTCFALVGSLPGSLRSGAVLSKDR